MTDRCFNLADLFEVVAHACPDRMCVVAGQHRLTYGELDERANRAGHHLLDAGIRPGEHVAILAHNRAEWLEAMLGALKARAVPINVNYRYTASELHHVLADSESVAVVGERSLLARLAPVRARLPLLRHTVVLEDGDDQEVPGAVAYEDVLAVASPAGDFGSRSTDDRYILYTGGTTGYPKGVVWRGEDIFFAAMGGGNIYGIPISEPGELASKAAEAPLVHLLCAPLMHGGAQWAAFIGLTNAHTLVLYTGRGFDPHTALSLVDAERVNILMVVGDAMARPVGTALAADPDRYDVSSLVVIGSGGAPLTAAAREQLRPLLPDVIFRDSYGASETGAGGPSVETEAGEQGPPRFSMSDEVAVLDDDMNPVQPGSETVGKLARSGHIPLGYYNDETKTAATFGWDSSGRRWVAPGDLATVAADGTIALLGRGSLVVNSGGEKVYPDEVESVLKTHPAVFDAVVVGVPDERLGQRVAAVVSRVPGGSGVELTREALVAHCREGLAGYKVPRQLVVVDEVQRHPTGKPDYDWAKQQLSSV